MLQRISLLVLVLLLAGVRRSTGQELAWVALETNLPGAVVYADSVLVGPVAGGVFGIAPQVRQLRLVAPERDSWSVAPVTQPVDLTPGDTLSLRVDFPYHYRIDSFPFGAAVYLETGTDRLRLGDTPLEYVVSRPLQGTLLVEKPGYVVSRLVPGEAVWNAYSVTLNPAPVTDPEEARVAWAPPKRHRHWIDYAALGTALVAGAAAVHYKFKADRLYAQYEETTDPSLRSQIQTYDTYSGVALGVMQAGVGIFAIRLALR